MTSREQPTLSIVIPVYNEERNVDALVTDLRAWAETQTIDLEAIAVDDGSDDESAALLLGQATAWPALRVLVHERNRGMGATLLDGTRAARGKYVIWMMADRSDRFDDIRNMLTMLEQGYDLVIASRAMRGGDYGELGRVKSFFSHTYSWTARLLFGMAAHDITNAFRGMKATLPAALDLRSHDFTISPEMAIKAHRAGARIAEIPTVYRYRQEGKSNFRLLRMGRRYAQLLWLRLLPRPRRLSL
ncbi:MAG TPA: glycosyltransferase family 2 protein [bacterium]|nr:glycosyltransferase family 2 protein [bacterium]